MIEQLAPGVQGYTMRDSYGALYVPVVISDSPGEGNVSRFIDDLLAKEQIIKFPCVINSKLEEMLKRRGFSLEMEYDETTEEFVDVWVWRKGGGQA